jgi:hypothetical protein
VRALSPLRYFALKKMTLFRGALKMKMLSWCVFGFFLVIYTVCFGQIDIYQSDAYSLEEMCAREAAQNTTMDYNSAYESCIAKNRDNPMYQSGGGGVEVQDAGESYADGTDQTETYSQNQGAQEPPLDQEESHKPNGI